MPVLLRPVSALLVALAAFGAPAAASDRPERDFDADVVAAIEHGELARLEKRPAATEPDASGYDVQKYTIDLGVDFTARTLDGRVRIDAVTTTSSLSSVALDFVGFNVSRVEVNGATVTATRGSDTIHVPVGPYAATGQAFSITIAYSGQPRTEGGLGFGFTSRGAATFAEPEGARLWFPCKDRPSDKAQYEGRITVPAGQVVASNGRLLDVADAPGGRKTYHWVETHQIATYLIMLGISNYQILEQRSGNVPIYHYVYPELASAAQRDFSRTPQMLEAFEQRIGVPYPFEKYGHALFENFGGAMEHQTMTSYGSRLITGDNRYDRVVAHELGHHWFGDLVSPHEWEEIWLNEGFATWTEFLWTEHVDPDYLPALMAGRESYYFDREAIDGRYPLYAPGMSRLFGPTIYQKGGWVVAMLRYVIGDEAFFAGLKNYLEANAYGTATTVELKEAMETASGMELDAFFDEWVYGVGYPTYDVSWSLRAVPSGGYQADVRIVQTQRGTPVFTIPLEVEVVYANGSRTRQRIPVASADHVASLCLDAEPRSILVDPDNKVLGRVSASSAPVAPQPLACGDPVPETLRITAVALVKSDGRWRFYVDGEGFVVGETKIEVNGVALAKTRYPKSFQNSDGTTSRLEGKNPRLRQEVLPTGTTVAVTVVNASTGQRSEPFTYQR